MRQAGVLLQDTLWHCWLQRQADVTHMLIASRHRGTSNRSKESGVAPGRACQT